MKKLPTTDFLRYRGAIPTATATTVGAFVWPGVRLSFRPNEKRFAFIAIRLEGPEVGAPAEASLTDRAPDGGVVQRA
jgi:hypothetical protein